MLHYATTPTHTCTLPPPQMAVEVRKKVNTLDNLTTTKAVDALLNAETVALFNNRRAQGGGAPARACARVLLFAHESLGTRERAECVSAPHPLPRQTPN